MQELWQFISLSDPNVRVVVLGTVLFAITAASVGVFALLRQRSLIGDAVAHSVLPGICLAFITFQQKNLLVLVVGAFITGWLSIICIDWISRNSKIKPDTAIGVVLSLFFGVGIVLLSYLQTTENAAQAGLEQFLFGNAATITQGDVLAFSIIAFVVLGTIVLLFQPFKLLSFDANYAKSIGFPVQTLELILSSITVFAIASGVQAVGAILMSAILITPALIGRFWTNNLLLLLIFAAASASFAAVGGAFISYAYTAMPTGPWIIMLLALIFVVSVVFAPKKGLLSKWLQRRNNQKVMLHENVLKIFYHLGEAEKEMYKPRFITELIERRALNGNDLKIGLKALTKKGLLISGPDTWQLTEEGMQIAARTVKLHRLWEMYLTSHLKIASDHVHNDAEAIEHIITPELEALLEKELGYPEEDPHGKPIVYQPKHSNS